MDRFTASQTSHRPLRATARLAGALTAFALLAPGCASTQPSGDTTPAAQASTATATAPCDPARDREAILRMAGTYDVGFRFAETVALVDGYKPKSEYVASAKEVVIVLEQSPTHVKLQHVLLLPRGEQPAMPLKHWRQDWTFEDRDILEFKGKFQWENRTLSEAEAKCTWSQAVYQVDDGPRYEGFGRFEYSNDDVATWTSNATWRPLPRREYTKRSDYDVLLAVNVHRIGKGGWTHEQDNRKWVMAEEKSLVVESGLNTYQRAELEHEQVAQDYMKETGQLWGEVRTAWTTVLSAPGRWEVKDKVDGKRFYEHLFGEEDKFSGMPDAERQAALNALIASYVVPAGTAVEPAEGQASNADEAQ